MEEKEIDDKKEELSEEFIEENERDKKIVIGIIIIASFVLLICFGLINGFF